MPHHAIETGWNPHNLLHCVDSTLLGTATAVLAFMTMCWYLIITCKWLAAAKNASPEARRVWIWLMAIFLVCSICGYGSLIVSLVSPRAFVILRLTLLVALNIACPMFLRCSVDQRFSSIAKFEGIGEQITKAVNALDQLSDQELASLARRIVAKSLERYAEGMAGGA